MIDTGSSKRPYWGRHRAGVARFLTLTDRCERLECDAQAFVRLSHPTNDHDILLCGHHGEEMLPFAAGEGYEIQDERYLLITVPPLAGESVTDQKGRVRKSGNQ